MGKNLPYLFFFLFQPVGWLVGKLFFLVLRELLDAQKPPRDTHNYRTLFVEC